MTPLQNYVITFLFFTCVVCTAIFFPDITAVFSIVGGLCAVTQGFVLPAAMSLKISRDPWYSCQNLFTLILALVIGFLGYSSVILTVFDQLGLEYKAHK